jgi:hypothetical protein
MTAMEEAKEIGNHIMDVEMMTIMTDDIEIVEGKNRRQVRLQKSGSHEYKERNCVWNAEKREKES